MKLLGEILLLALLSSGCTSATSALWGRKTHHPAVIVDGTNLNLAFAPQTNDILVRYEEQVNKSTNSQARAYWLFASTNAPIRTTRQFVQEISFGDLIQIPIVRSKKDFKTESPSGYRAISVPGQISFQLWKDDKKIGRYKLPCYSEWEPATAWRVALTPGAVTADALVTTSATALIIFFYGHGIEAITTAIK
jgi:hypothetical protein